MKTMSRTSTIVLRLNLQAPVNLDEVVRYWSCNRRNKEGAFHERVSLGSPPTICGGRADDGSIARDLGYQSQD